MLIPSLSSAVAVAENMLEFGGHCLFCGCEEGQIAVDHVEDWFFHALAGQFTFMRCQACKSLWLRDRLKAEFLPIAYKAYYTHGQEQERARTGGLKAALKGGYIRSRFGGSGKIGDRLLAKAYLALGGDRVATDDVYRYAPPAPAKLLDYGCGSGAYLAQMRVLGYDVTGVDFDPVSVRRVSALGIPALTPDEAPDDDWQGRYDFITLGHVIEHVPAPRSLLSRLAAWLRPGGKLFLETPNAGALGLEVLGRYWRGLEAPRHLALPSREGLHKALESAGLSITHEILKPHLRQYLWQESVSAAPDSDAALLMEKTKIIPGPTKKDNEFLTILATR